MTRPYRVDDLVDFDVYPLDETASPKYKVALSHAREQLQYDGCAVIKNLLRPTAVKIISQEIIARKQTTHFSTSSMNPYFHSTKNPDYPDHHPVNTFIERSSGFIPGDSWDSSLAIDVLFRSDALTAFIRDCLETDSVYCYADPLAGLTANILDPGHPVAPVHLTYLVGSSHSGGRKACFCQNYAAQALACKAHPLCAAMPHHTHWSTARLHLS
jgi:hypothetical protein